MRRRTRFLWLLLLGLALVSSLACDMEAVKKRQAETAQLESERGAFNTKIAVFAKAEAKRLHPLSDIEACSASQPKETEVNPYRRDVAITYDCLLRGAKIGRAHV